MNNLTRLTIEEIMSLQEDTDIPVIRKKFSPKRGKDNRKRIKARTQHRKLNRRIKETNLGF